MRVLGATAFHFDVAVMKRPLLPCNCGSQTQLSKSVWGQMPPPPPPPPPHFIYPFLLLAVTSLRPASSLMWAEQALAQTPNRQGHVANWVLAGHLLLPSEQEEKQKTAASSAETMGKRSEMPLLLAASEGKRGERKPFNPQGRQRENRGLGLLGCSSRDPCSSKGLPLQEQTLPFKQHATPWVRHFLSLEGWLWN